MCVQMRILIALAACACGARIPTSDVTFSPITDMTVFSFQAADSNGTLTTPLEYTVSTTTVQDEISSTRTVPVTKKPYSIADTDTEELEDDLIEEGNTCPSLENGDSLTQTEMIRRMVADCRYDRLLRPGGGSLTVVHARSYIYFIQAEAAHDLQFELHVLLQLRYTDERLAYRRYSPERRGILGENHLKNLIWLPHIFLTLEKQSSIMGTDAKDMLVSISPDGEVLFSRRIQAVLYCWLDLKKFPFDEQTCSMNFETWMYNVSELQLKWEIDYPVQLAPELHLTQYSLLSHWTNESYEQRHGGFAGNYSTLRFSFRLAREAGYYLMDYFIPSIMIVSISWVSFWLQADQSAPRIMLGTSTLLSFITLASAQSKNLPKVSYIKASEIWFLGCTGFIFGSLIEFAFVNTIWRRRKNIAMKNVNSKQILKYSLTPRLARKELQKEFSESSLQKAHSCSSLDGIHLKQEKQQNSGNNHLSVQGAPSELKLPIVTFDLLTPDQKPQNPTSAPECCTNKPGQRSGSSGDASAPHAVPHGWTTMTPHEIARWIDTRSRFFFPLSFVFFNVLYWTFVYAL